MQSSGGLADAHAFQGKDAILSGPAGGIVGMARTAQLAGHHKVIGFDMGGTSTDVSHFAGEFEREFETQVAGVRMRAPMMSIHTVAAGGGSILEFDGSRFRVGPQSAGANPGPASYRRGGPLAVTDANVMVGKIQPRYFPKVFGPHANEALSYEAVEEKFAELARKTGRAAEVVAEGFINIAVQQMANAIKKISVARGYDVTRYTLQCFGGAGGQHACMVADALGMSRVFIHPLAGVLSAYGMGLADQNVIREQAIELPLASESLPLVGERLDALAAAARAELQRQQAAAGAVTIHRRVHVRYEGSDSALVVPFGDMQTIVAGFEAAYRQRFAFLMQGKSMMVEAVSVEAVVAGDAPAEPRHPVHPVREVPRRETVRMYSGGQWHDAALVVREDLRPGDVIRGPAIIAEKNATTVIEPGWEAQLTRSGPHRAGPPRAARPEIRGRHESGPGAARSVQQPLHEHRRADGAAAAEHGVFGQHQGAARFFLRPVRCRRQPDRQCAAHAGAPGLDGREHQDGDPRERGPDFARRRLRAERSLSWRHALAGRDGDHARVICSPRPSPLPQAGEGARCG